MKLVIQRVKSASVSIDGQVYNAIQQGLLLLVVELVNYAVNRKP